VAAVVVAVMSIDGSKLMAGGGLFSTTGDFEVCSL